jgi:hypothetical protein
MPQGGAGFFSEAGAIPPHQREGFRMDINAWVLKLNSLGFKNALQHPKTTVAFYVAYEVLKWVAIALAIAAAATVWLMISVIASAVKGR